MARRLKVTQYSLRWPRRKMLSLITIFPLLLMLAGCGALIKAAEKGEVITVKELLEKGANIEEKDSYGDTALMRAAENGRTETVKLLLDKGANVNAESNFGVTPLIYAARSGNSDMVTILLERGAKIYAKGRWITEAGDTPLSMAAYSGNVGIMKMLIDRGADVEEAIWALENTEKHPNHAQKARRGIQELKKFSPGPRKGEAAALRPKEIPQQQPA
jgi:ankyrin repeat protein